MSKEIWNQSCIISPSLICLDLCNLEQQVRLVEESGIRMLHVDILDGHFSPSMPLGLETVKQLRKKTDLEFEAHVMTANPQYFIDELLECGVSQIVFHIETADHVDGLLNSIHGKGVRAGVAAKCFTVAVNSGPLPDKALADEGADLIYQNMIQLCAGWEELTNQPNDTEELTKV